jgi:tetratricopeptide (TPR) repeat protein
MKCSTTLTLSAAFLASLPLLSAQEPTSNKAKIELKDGDTSKDPALKLDPTGKLPSANKEDALVPLQSSNQEKAKELPAALQKLSKEDLNKFASLRDDATSYMRSVRLQEALEKLSQAEAIVGETIAEIENLRGAVYTKMRDFKTARTHFGKSVTLDGDSFHPKFNLSELDFVEKNWDAAIKGFNALIVENEKMKKEAAAKFTDEETRSAVERQFDSTTRLMQFKIMICQMQSEKSNEALQTQQSFAAYDNDSPAYYFAKAVQSFVKEQKESAEEWIASAKSIYPAEVTEVYIDSLVEMGWLSTLQQ